MAQRKPAHRSVRRAHKRDTIEIQGDHGTIEVARNEVIERLDEIADTVLPRGAPPRDQPPTEDSSWPATSP